MSKALRVYRKIYQVHRNFHRAIPMKEIMFMNIAHSLPRLTKREREMWELHTKRFSSNLVGRWLGCRLYTREREVKFIVVGGCQSCLFLYLLQFLQFTWGFWLVEVASSLYRTTNRPQTFSVFLITGKTRTEVGVGLFVAPPSNRSNRPIIAV